MSVWKPPLIFHLFAVRFLCLTLFWLCGYQIDTCLQFSLYFWHGFCSESEQPDGNRVNKSNQRVNTFPISISDQANMFTDNETCLNFRFCRPPDLSLSSNLFSSAWASNNGWTNLKQTLYKYLLGISLTWLLKLLAPLSSSNITI